MASHALARAVLLEDDDWEPTATAGKAPAGHTNTPPVANRDTSAAGLVLFFL